MCFGESESASRIHPTEGDAEPAKVQETEPEMESEPEIIAAESEEGAEDFLGASPEFETAAENILDFKKPDAVPDTEPETEPETLPEAEASGKEPEWNPKIESGEHGPEGEKEPKAEAEQQAEAEPEAIPEGEAPGRMLSQWITLFTLCILIIIVGNILIILIILRNKKTRTEQANVFFLSLLVARTSVAIFVIPARITGLFSNELLGSVLCKLCHYAGRGSAVTSVLSTTAVALPNTERFRISGQSQFGSPVCWWHSFGLLGIYGPLGLLF